MATTEKMLPPGMMPGKNEIEKYIQLYEDDPEFTLADRIEDFDSSVLDKRYVDTFCSRYPYYTGVGNEVDAWIDGTRSRLGLIQLSG